MAFSNWPLNTLQVDEDVFHFKVIDSHPGIASKSRWSWLCTWFHSPYSTFPPLVRKLKCVSFTPSKIWLCGMAFWHSSYYFCSLTYLGTFLIDQACLELGTSLSQSPKCYEGSMPHCVHLSFCFWITLDYIQDASLRDSCLESIIFFGKQPVIINFVVLKQKQRIVDFCSRNRGLWIFEHRITQNKEKARHHA